MWWFYLLCVVQSLWLDLSQSKSDSNKSPLSSLNGAYLSPVGGSTLISFLSAEKGHLKHVGGELLHDTEQKNSPIAKNNDDIFSQLPNDLLNLISKSDSFRNAAEATLKTVLNEILSLEQSVLNPESRQPRSGTEPDLNIPDLIFKNSHSVSPPLHGAAGTTKCVELATDDGSLELCIAAISCSDFSVADVPSSYQPPTSLYVALHDLSLSCTASWNLTYTTHMKDMKRPRVFEYEGSVGVIMSGFTSSVVLDLVPGGSLAALEEEILIPTGLKIEECQVNTSSFQFEVSFTGGAIGRVLNKVVAPLLSDAVVTSLDWLLCDVFSPLLGRVATRLLVSSIDPRIDSIMALGVKPSPVLKSGFVSWNTSVLHTVHQVIDAMRVNEASLLKCVLRESAGLLAEENDYVDTWSRDEDDSEGGSDGKDSSATTFAPRVNRSPLVAVLKDLEAMLESAVKDVGVIVSDVRKHNLIFPAALSGVSLDVLAVSIHGFNTLSDLELFYPSDDSNVTLNSSLSFAVLDIEIDFRLTREGSNSEADHGRDIRFGVHLTDLVIDVDIVAAFASSSIDQLFLDQALQPPCLLSALQDLFISSLLLNVHVHDISLHAIDVPDIIVDTGEDINALINNLFQVVVEGYPEMTSQLLAGLFQGPVRESINDKITEARISFHKKNPQFICEAHVTSNSSGSPSDWIQWPDSPLVQGFNNIVNDMFGPVGVNSLLSCLTQEANSVLINVPLASPVFAGWNITLSGLNSFYNFEIFSSIREAPFDLLTDIALGGYCPSSVTSSLADSIFKVDDRPVPAEQCIPLNITIQGYEHNHNYVDVKLSVKNIRLILDLLLEIDRNALSNMQVSELHTQGCLANAVDIFQVANWSLVASSVEFYFVEETSEIPLTELVNNVFSALLSPANEALLNSRLSAALITAREVCSAGGVSPSSDTTDALDPHYDHDDSVMHFFRHTWKWKVVVLMICTLLSFSFLLRMYYKKGVQLDASVGNYLIESDTCTASCAPLGSVLGGDSGFQGNSDNNINNAARNASQPSDCKHGSFLSNKWIQYNLQRVVSAVHSCRQGCVQDPELLAPRVPPVDSLIGNEAISLFTRVSVVFFILLIVYIFIISEIPSSPAALVILEIDMGGQVSPPITVFKFGLAETIREMWQAEVYYLAILIAFFTGGWPYIKMVAMLLAWVLPSAVLSVARRNSLLVWLDILGKWSLVDSFVMMVMMVGFNFSFDIVPGVDIRVTVNPQWGFYAFLLATAASLAVGHFVLACHRLCSAVAEKEAEEQVLLKTVQEVRKSEDGAMNNLPECLDVFLESNSCNPCDEVKINAPCVQENNPHLHFQWANQVILPASAEDLCAVALMNHVFSVKIINTEPDILSRHDDGGGDGDDITAPLVDSALNDDAAYDPMDEKRVVHLSDLAEWKFQPCTEKMYTLSIQFTQLGKVFMILLFGLSTLLVLGGTFIPVIEFDFIGLTGYLMDEPVTSYSLVDIGFNIPVASGEPHRFGVLFIQIIYFVFGIGMPILFFALLGGVFIIPFSLPTFRGVVVLMEVLSAWSALDVLVVSGVASVLEIRRFAQFMLGAGCDEMNAILEETMDEPLEGNDTCFDVIASMKNTSWMAYTAAFLLITVGLLLRFIAHKAIDERSMAKKRIVFSGHYTAESSTPSASASAEVGGFSRVYNSIWLHALRGVHAVGIVSVKKKAWCA